MAAAGDAGAATASGRSTITPPPLALITTVGCPYCKRAKAALQQAGLQYEELELSSFPQLLAEVFVQGRLLGGATELVAALEDGSLKAQLAAAGGGQPALPPALRETIDAALKSSADSAAGAGEEAESAELSKLAALAEQMKAAGLGTAHSQTQFSLHAALEWVQQARGLCLAGPEAAQLLGQLQAAQLLTLAGSGSAQTDVAITPELAAQHPSTRLLLVADAPLPSRLGEPLNSHFCWFGPARPASEVELSGLSRDELICFAINAYNALVLHATAVLGPAGEQGTLGRLRWFEGIAYDIGGLRFSANDLEHGVLRGNAPSPASLALVLGLPRSWAGRSFKRGDPRAALAVEPIDPRIHFALNCGAASCPPIRVYTPEALEFGLDSAARAFCASEVEVDATAGEVTLSMIMKYGSDFGSQAQLLEFVAEHTAGSTQDALRRLLASGRPVQLRFRPYDWSTNAAD
eukprot:scaffold18.g1935.t1